MNISSLTNAQKVAIDHFEGPALIIAGPGAGKTHVLAERVYSLINKRNVDPSHILLTTFGNKAADELRVRIGKRIGTKAELIHISTIHSFCKSLLEMYPDKHNFGAIFDILNDDKQLMFLRGNYGELGLERTGLYNHMVFYNKCGENNIDPDELIYEIKNKYPQRQRYYKACVSYKKYLKLMEEKNKVDFSGLQKYALTLLENNPDVLSDVRDKYQFILVDEFQDTNPIQDKLFELIAKPKCNICVVGDDDQSIYAFRGADIDNLLRFTKKYENTKVIKLKKNFRSTSNIIEISEEFMGNYRQEKKKILPERSEGNSVILLKSEDDQDEAKKIVDLIKKMKEKDIIPHYGYVTLLFRTLNHARKIIEELKYHDMPYEVKGDKSFLKREEIRTMLYLLSYVDPPNYDGKFQVHWREWWNISMFENEFLSLSNDTLHSLRKLDKSFDLSTLLEPSKFKEVGIENEEDIFKILKLNLLKKELNLNSKSVLSLFYDIIQISGYLKWLIKDGTPKSDEKLFNLAKLSSIINKYEEFTAEPTIGDFLSYFYTLPKKLQYNAEIFEDPHSLKLMTVHQAKGLEFPVVIVCSVVNNKFPIREMRDQDLVRIPEHLLMYRDEKYTDEERRVFYVAMTRAQDNLIISTSENTNTNRMGISQFITDDIGFEKFSDVNALIESCKKREIVKNPIRISYSSINAFKNCPFMYKMTYFYFFEFISTHKQKYGIILHNCLNRIHKSMKNGEIITEETIDEIVESCWISIHKNDKDDLKRQKELKMKIFKYYESAKENIKEVISTEEPFSLYANGMLIGGRTDLIYKNKDDETELVDFKARGEAGITETFVEMQLKVYEYGLNSKYNFDKLCAYQFEGNKKTYFEPNGVDFTEITNEMDNICNKIEMEQFDPVKTQLCSQCFFKFLCG